MVNKGFKAINNIKHIRHGKHKPTTVLFFPWHCHNRMQLLIDGEQFYPAILKAIALAQHTIFIEMYLVLSGETTDHFIAALTAKVQQGIDVRLVFDDFGAAGLLQHDRQRLRNAGVALHFYNPVRLVKFKRNLRRTHRKIIVIDGKIAFTGGAGIADYFTGQTAWRETMIMIQGEVVADWQQLFLAMFHSLTATSITPDVKLLSVGPATRESQHTMLARVIHSAGGTRIALKRSLLQRIRQSKQTIWLATAYFIPSLKIRRALRRAASQGKDVRLLLPGLTTDHPAVVYASRRYYAPLLRQGVRIYEYQDRFMHTKVALIDDWVSIGSSNMDRWNLLWNLEANQEIKDSAFAVEVKTMLYHDLQQCNEIGFAAWANRSYAGRLREWLWGKIDVWLSRWRNNG